MGRSSRGYVFLIAIRYFENGPLESGYLIQVSLDRGVGKLRGRESPLGSNGAPMFLFSCFDTPFVGGITP